ncbi:LuxR C-terminal-related transcriptional regulator [Citrobacter sp. JGM124]|uniref:helix-turn-helix transcriptional regulator n=1 Tax=Citrobacter sp. JGM124 TaxID=2799789 RepID=UPI001BAB60BD|nr:LuxR C-terminal-related transcriptional regulator [Citrobacter sp. JGM124]MBS0849111.1 response regulator transcription factor [Citrobacter sp. JGM124]
MYKILVVDRCCFSRLGLKTWLSQAKFQEQNFILAEADNLQLTREMMLTWQPHLIIADFNSFLTTLNNIRQLSIIHEVRDKNTRFILLQRNHHSSISEVKKIRDNINSLDKSVSLSELEDTILRNVCASPEEKNQKRSAMPLLTLREERILKLWKEEVHNTYIAKLMGISIKTVYTYKRNIRMKLGAENRLSLFMNIS